jgi:hypothetical protein
MTNVNLQCAALALRLPVQITRWHRQIQLQYQQQMPSQLWRNKTKRPGILMLSQISIRHRKQPKIVSAFCFHKLKNLTIIIRMCLLHSKSRWKPFIPRSSWKFDYLFDKFPEKYNSHKHCNFHKIQEI